MPDLDSWWFRIFKSLVGNMAEDKSWHLLSMLRGSASPNLAKYGHGSCQRFELMDCVGINCFYIGLSLASSSCNSTVHLEMEVLKVVQVLILDQFAFK